jgi:hypothetical protein
MRDSSSPESGVRNSATRLSRTVQRHTPCNQCDGGALASSRQRTAHSHSERLFGLTGWDAGYRMHASLRSHLVLSCPCILCRAQEAPHRLGGPNTPPRRAGSSFCQDDMRHSVGTTRPSRASGVQFSFPSSLRFFNFSPPYFLLLRQSHHDYDSEVFLGFSDR